MKAFHYRVNRFPCSVCCKSFAYPHSLRCHLKKHYFESGREMVFPRLTVMLRFTTDEELKQCTDEAKEPSVGDDGCMLRH